jgi:hypothetical protein
MSILAWTCSYYALGSNATETVTTLDPASTDNDPEVSPIQHGR